MAAAASGEGMSLASHGKGCSFLCLCVLHREMKERHETLLFFSGYIPREYLSYLEKTAE